MHLNFYLLALAILYFGEVMTPSRKWRSFLISSRKSRHPSLLISFRCSERFFGTIFANYIGLWRKSNSTLPQDPRFYHCFHWFLNLRTFHFMCHLESTLFLLKMFQTLVLGKNILSIDLLQFCKSFTQIGYISGTCRNQQLLH